MDPLALNSYDFTLPEELIAQRPAEPRDHARLLVYDRRTRQITDDYFYNIDKFLPPETTLVLNNSKVEKCRLKFPDKMEIFVVDEIDPLTILAMVHPGRKFKPGAQLTLAGLRFEVVDVNMEGLRTIRLERPLDDPALDPYRQTPLPPYIEHNESLADDYQTVYAKTPGSKAAPTAGLHFTAPLLQSLGAKHPIAEITLHVGLGTFAPIKSERLDQHELHSEWYVIDPPMAELLNQARHRTAVGSTSVRVLETSADTNGHFEPISGETSVFIKPGYQFHATQAIITNFHLPKSSLLMMVAAFLGSVEELHQLYAYAIKKEYRFYSFGDAMLIL